MATFRAVLWKAKEQEGLIPIYVRIEAANKRCYVSIGERVRPRDWNAAKGRVRKSHTHAVDLNTLVEQTLDGARWAHLQLRVSGIEITPAAIKKAMKPHAGQPVDLVEYGCSYSEELRTLGKIPTSRRYASILRKVRAFAGGPVPLEAVTAEFVRRLERHLVVNLSNGQGYRRLKPPCHKEPGE